MIALQYYIDIDKENSRKKSFVDFFKSSNMYSLGGKLKNFSNFFQSRISIIV